MNVTLEKVGERDVHDEYERALRRSKWSQAVARLRRRSAALISLDNTLSEWGSAGQHYLGLAQVPVSQIVGSVGRTCDFDRNFMPMRNFTHDRWVSIARAVSVGAVLPPVELYKVGDRYFVRDGHHRVSVARYSGIEYVDAEVVEIRVACQGECNP